MIFDPCFHCVYMCVCTCVYVYGFVNAWKYRYTEQSLVIQYIYIYFKFVLVFCIQVVFILPTSLLVQVSKHCLGDASFH